VKKLKLNRKKIVFEYEFADGTTEKLSYFEPTTDQIDRFVAEEEMTSRLMIAKETLQECLASEKEGVTSKVIDEQMHHGNIYDFKAALDEELGKLKKIA